MGAVLRNTILIGFAVLRDIVQSRSSQFVLDPDVAIGADVGFVEIKSDKGHDSFLLNVPDFLNTLKNYLKTTYLNLNEKRI